MGRELLGAGWDSTAVLVDGTWVERTARRAAVEPWLRTETRLLPWLAPRLPVPVPRPEVVGEEPLVVRHRLLVGDPLAAPPPALAAALGRFLAALHAVPLDGAVAAGVPGPAVTTGMRDAAFARFAADVVPRLAPGPAARLADRLAALADAPAAVLVHGDLRPDHVLVRDGAITGVIDWSDARAGDPAKDLGGALTGLGPAAADALVAAYGTDLRARAADWDAVGPCYAVAHGLDTGDDALVSASLDRLARGGPR